VETQAGAGTAASRFSTFTIPARPYRPMSLP